MIVRTRLIDVQLLDSFDKVDDPQDDEDHQEGVQQGTPYEHVGDGHSASYR